MKHADLCKVTEPVVSVITPSLNHAKFLRATLDSVAAQTFRNFEHVVIDGGSSDGTVEILREYPHVRWISEPDDGVLDAYHKALRLARGRYIIQCCVSDGFHSPGWFAKCVELLERNENASLVWALPQYMSEEGSLLEVAFQDFLADPPPQMQNFLPFWLATRFLLPEGNYCVRANVLRENFPNQKSEQHYRIHCHLGFMYNFMHRGYCPLFVPEVVNYGRLHAGQRGQRLRDQEKPAYDRYIDDVRAYARKLFCGEITHVFRDGASAVIAEVHAPDAARIRKQYWAFLLSRSRLLRTPPYWLWARIKSRIGATLSWGARK